MRRISMLTGMAATLALATAAGAQTSFSEIEPNETKAQALANGPFTLAPGSSVTGTTTGVVSTPGATSLDTFLIRTVAQPLGIYRYTLTLTSPTVGHTASIRGLTQTGSTTGGSINVGTDIAAQTSLIDTATGARSVVWFGFGRQEQIYYRVTGTTSTTGAYTSTLSREAVTPIQGPTNVVGGGPVTLTAVGQGHTTDTEMWLYDSNLNAIPLAGNDDTPSPYSLPSTLTRVLLPGTYTLAIANWQMMNNLPSPGDDGFTTGNVLDFPNAILSSSTTATSNLTFSIIDSASNSQQVVVNRTSPFSVEFIRFTVVAPVGPTNPTAIGQANPGNVSNSGTGTSVLTVQVTPGLNPTSSGVTVTVDGSQIGLASNLTLLDNGVAPDAVAGDNIFTRSVTVAANTPAGAVQLPFNVADAQSRSATGNIAMNIINPPPANDECANAEVITGEGQFGFANTQATTSTPTASCGGMGKDVWFRWTVPTTGGWIFATCDTSPGFDSVVQVYRGPSCPTDASNSLGCNDDSCGLLSRVTVNDLTAGTQVLIRIGSFFDGAGSDSGTLTISPAPTTNPVVFGAATPNPILNDLARTVTLRGTVTPGANPASTDLGVTVDASSIGLGTITLRDNGLPPDATAGDNIFNANITVPQFFAAGAYTLPVTVTDTQGRTGSANITLTVNDAIGACCLPAGCQTLSAAACSQQGGRFLGNNSTCTTGANYQISTPSTYEFEDIAATGSPLSITTGTGDDGFGAVDLGFDFTFYGSSFNQAFVCTNGFVSFGAGYTTFTNTAIPTAATPNNAAYFLWDDLDIRTRGTIVTETRGTAPNRRFIVQWTDVPAFGAATGSPGYTFQGVLFEGTNRIEMRWDSVPAETPVGDYTIGVENNDGTSAVSIPGADIGTGLTSRSFTYLPGSPACTPQCRADYNGDGVRNTDDISDFITEYFTQPAVPGPGGYAVPCPGAPAPYATNGYKCDINGDCFINTDDVSDFITEYFNANC